MAGIALCEYSECPKCKTCNRFTEERNEFSSFAEFRHICSENNDYKYYWKDESEEKLDANNNA